MNGDGKAGMVQPLTRVINMRDEELTTGVDYVWLDPQTGMIICWLNNLPDRWSSAGTNNSIIGSGAGQEASVFLAVS